MPIQSGTVIYSSSLLKESIFENTIIVIVSNNDAGALGFIINQLSDKSLNDLEEFKASIFFRLDKGGPVDEEHLFFIHRRADLIQNGKQIIDDIYFGGDFSSVITALNRSEISTSELKIFIGYCGWDAGELEAEVEEGSWLIANDLRIF